MAAGRSWWRMRRIKHRDTVVLAVLAAAFLLAGELVNNDIPLLYQSYIVERGALTNVALLVIIVALVILGFTTYFGGIFVLLGGMHFSWGRVSRGRFLVGLGIGVSLLGFVGRLARATLATWTPVAELITIASSLTGLGLLFGLASHSLMSQYALMLKKHARSVLRRWRRTRRTGREYELRPHRLRT
jgi:hypothetical protein